MTKRDKVLSRRRKDAHSSTSWIMDGVPKAKSARIAARRYRKFNEKRLGKMGAASECVSLSASSQEFADIASRYGVDPERTGGSAA